MYHIIKNGKDIATGNCDETVDFIMENYGQAGIRSLCERELMERLNDEPSWLVDSILDGVVITKEGILEDIVEAAGYCDDGIQLSPYKDWKADILLVWRDDDEEVVG